MLKVNLFGQFDLRLEDEPLELSSRPAQTLFAYLLLHREVVHRRERLAGILWPDSPENSARKGLRNALWHLRRTIGDVYLVTDRNSIAFNTAASYTLDVAILESKVERDDPEELIRLVSVYHGKLLPGFYEDWVLLERQRLRALFDRRLETLLDRLVVAGRWDDVRTWAERWIALGHVPEPAYRALMTAYAGLGDLAGMASSYRRCLQALDDELGVSPADETQTLYERLSSGQVALVAPTAVADPTVREQWPEPGHTGNLPLAPAPFFGREAELGEIGRLLVEEAECRLLTLVGPGGIGKSRLAIEAARATQFADGAWLVPLAPLSSSRSLVFAIADAVQLPLHGSTGARAQLLRYLQERGLLLILDNFEHLLSPLRAEKSENGPDGVALITGLLETCASVKLLLTSRERLNLSTEWVFNVEGLQTPGLDVAAEPGRALESYSAVQLFLQRARQVNIEFGQEDDEVACAGRICRLVGGMPLAIELAAAWINVLSCRDILEEIRHNLSFLRTNLRDYPERHRDIRAVFDTSWQMLTASERRLFRRLSVFRGGFTRPAAEAVGGEAQWTEEDLSLQREGKLQLARRQPQVVSALARLVDKSFVRRTISGRYEIHELMRQYGAAKLLERPEEEKQARDKHTLYYLNFLVRQERPIRGSDQRRVLEAAAPEIENIKTAWHWAAVRQRLDWLGRMLPAWLWLFEIRNDFEDAAAATAHAVELFRRQRAPHTLAHGDEHEHFAFLLSQAGWFAFRCGQTERARAFIDEALSLLGTDSDPQPLWYANANRSFIEVSVSNLTKARRFAEEALQQARALASPWHIGWPLAILGMIVLEEGDPPASYELLQESLALWLEVGDPRGLIFAYTHLGAATLALEKNEEALGYAEQCLALGIDVDDRWSQANALRVIGQARAAQGDYEEAEHAFRESIALYREVGDSWGTAVALVNLGNAALDAGELEQAGATFAQALRPSEQAQAVATGLSALVGLARVEAEGDQLDWARSLASYVAGHPQASEYARDAARQLRAEIGDRVSRASTARSGSVLPGSAFPEVARIVLARRM